MDAVITPDRLDTLQKIELAEGVNVRLRVAGLPVRFMAFMIDYIICGLIMTVSLFVIGLLGIATLEGGAAGLFLLVWFLVRWFYNVPFELGKRGATWGKRAMKLKVVRHTGAPLSAGQSVTRNLLRFVDEMPVFIATTPLFPTYLIGALAIILSKRFQRLGDLAAGTIVIYSSEEAERQYHRGFPAFKIEETKPAAPRYPLQREEQLAFSRYRERLSLWSDARRIEIADHLEPLTHKKGAEGVDEIVRISAWIEEAK